MKLQQLNENELRIILSKEDLRELDLTLRTIDYNTTKTRKAIWEIFDRARDQTGFDAAKNKIYIKLYPLTDGGCEMYVSKLTGDSHIALDSQCYTAKRQSLRYCAGDTAFRFGDFDSLYSACKALSPQAESMLYTNDDGEFILLLKKLARTPSDLRRWSEFGEQIKGKYISAYLNEHCKMLIPGCAIQKIMGKG